MTGSPPDVTALPDLLQGRSRAGPVRERRPVYVDLMPPCNAGCPAGENIQAWLAHTQAGRHEQAWSELVADNPFPAIHGRVCYHPCESVCNRANLDSAVSIHAVERFLGDLVVSGVSLSIRWRRAAAHVDRAPALTGAVLHVRVRSCLAAMTASALLRHGPGYAAVLLDDLSDWMTRKGFAAVDELRGLLSVPQGTDAGARERAGYVNAVREANSGAYGPW